ncbi:hypothetical protein IC582_020344 [Cucumis melo]
MQKGEIATNVLDVCDTKGDFVYVLAGWEGFAADSRILCCEFSVMSLPDKRDCKCQRGFLTPYRGQLYHLQEWHGDGNALTTAKEYFNMKHSLTRNVIERAFSVLKGCWVILHGKSYYPLQVLCRTILAYCLLHNLINKEITNCDDIDEVDEGDSAYAMTTTTEDIQYIDMTTE